MDPTLPPLPDPPGLSPTLDLLPQAQRPSPMPACGHCRRAMWLLAGSQLACYCTGMRVIVWDGVKAPVRSCDGQWPPAAAQPVSAA